MAKVIFQFLIVSTLFTVLSVPYDAVINAHEDMSFVAVLGIFEAVMKLLIALFVTYTSFDKLGAYGLFMALLTIVLLIIRRFYCYKKYEEARVNIRAYYDKSLFREMTSFGGWSLLGSASGLIANYGQGIVINMFFGTAVNAAQSVANQVSGQVGAFSSTMLKALNPVIAKSEGAGQRKVMIQASITGSKFSFYLFALFSIPIIIEMPLILNYWLEDVPDYAMVFCRLLLIINLIDQMFITLPTSIASTGKIKNYQKTVSLLALTPLILTYFLFYWSYPPETLYLVFIGHRLVRAFGPVLYFSKKVFGLSVKYYLKEVVLRCIAITLLAVIPSYLLHKAIHIDGLRLILVGLLSGVLFILSVWWIGLSKVEKQYIVKMIKALLSKLPIKFT